YKPGFEFGLPQGDQKQSLIDISRHQMHVMLLPWALAKNVIASLQNFPDGSGILLLFFFFDQDPVSDCHRVRQFVFAQSEFSDNATGDCFLTDPDRIPTSG